MGNCSFTSDILIWTCFYFVPPGRVFITPRSVTAQAFSLLWLMTQGLSCTSSISTLLDLKAPQQQASTSFGCPWLLRRIGTMSQSCSHSALNEEATMEQAGSGCKLRTPALGHCRIWAQFIQLLIDTESSQTRSKSCCQPASN